MTSASGESDRAPESPDTDAPEPSRTENRLARETSPYLRQHRHNPVEWYPWGEEAHRRAREEDRPILLSIGYSACHWCHVMERESFDDPDTARLMNDSFVNIKVDREERPDVDSIYMRAVQALTGRGGWPLTVFLTPDGEPFYGGTYFPPEPHRGMPSFRQVLEATRSAWDDRRDDVQGAASEIRGILERSTRSSGDAAEDGRRELDATLTRSAAESILRHLDHGRGGFGQAPKFPQPLVLSFLLERHATTGERPPLEGAVLTLRKMARGGIRDQLGGGFHRYSVDARWLVPHFEKMLYDNALLARTYLNAFQLTGDPEMETVCREVLDDLLDDFRSPEGGFYTARDADSEGEEGLFYLWTPDQVAAELEEDDARLFRRAYDVTEGGNFEGRNILHLPHDLEALARQEGLTREELESRLDSCRRALKQARTRREPPLRDEKILASWNGFAIRTLAEVGAALDDREYLEAAERGADWLLRALRADGALRHQVGGDGTSGVPAFLDDVAALGNATLSLYEATLNARWLREAIELDERIEERYRDPDTGLLFDTPDDGEKLVIRPREVTDSPIPSGSSLAAELRLRLGRLMGDRERIESARAIVEAELPAVSQMPSGFGRLLCVAERLLAPSVEVAILGPPDASGTAELLREAHRPFLPGRVIGGGPESASGEDGGSSAAGREAGPDLALLEGRKTVDGRPTAYVCRNFTCERPTTSPAELAGQLEARGRPSA